MTGSEPHSPDAPGRPFFRLTPEELIPEQTAASGWGTNQMRGPAVSGALSRAAELRVRALGRHDLQPVRWTLDLFRPVRMLPCSTSTTVVRESRRLCLVDSVLHQDGQPVARASALFLSPGDTPPGEVWSGGAHPQPPPADHPRPAHAERLYFSEHTGWRHTLDGSMSDRHQIWHYAIPIVADEQPTPFQLAATVADVMNVVSNFGSNGMEFINPDATMVLARLPDGPEIGLSATDRIERHGISVGTAVVFDRTGVLGTATVSGLANAHRAIEPTRVGKARLGLPS